MSQPSPSPRRLARRRSGGLAPLLLSTLLASSAVAAPEVISAPKSLLLEETTEVKVVVRSATPVRASASVGKLVHVGSEGEEHRFDYRPPESRAPSLAHLAFWSDQDTSVSGAPELTLVRIPLLGRTELEIDTEPNASVRVEVAGKTFGPVSANRKGKVVVPILVPPDARVAKVFAQTKGLQSGRDIPLDIPPFNPLLVAAGPEPMPRAGGWLWVVHEGYLDGRSLELVSRGLRLERVEILRDRALFRVFPTASAKELKLQARLSNDPEANAETSLAVGDETQIASGAPGPFPPSPGAPVRSSFSIGAGVLGLYSGNANAGFGVAVFGGWAPPGLDRRLTLELEVGARTAEVRASPAGNGTGARLVAIPLELAARGRIVQLENLGFHARLGGGLVPFSYSGDATRGSGDDRGLGWEAFAAIQISGRLGALEPFGELRGSLGQTRAGPLNGSVNGGLLVLGLRFAP